MIAIKYVKISTNCITIFMTSYTIINKIAYKITKYGCVWYPVGGQNALIESECCGQICYLFYFLLLINGKFHSIYWADMQTSLMMINKQ